jgi:hypothetical protein
VAILIEYPWLAAAIGVLFVALGRRTHRTTAAVVGLVWLLYAAYETGMRLRWLCSGECNIRVDLLLIYPGLLIATVAAIVTLVRAGRVSGR